MAMDSHLPEKPKKHNTFDDWMKSMNGIFPERPMKNFLKHIDEFFASSFPVEMREKENEYWILAKLPGVSKEQIGIEINAQFVTITVSEQEYVLEENEKRQTVQEKTSFRRQSRTIPLPALVNEKMAKAKYKDGLLTLILPKKKGKIIELSD
ncbi:Hsp20/alpha crystallin family protein [Bacillus smithii]|uniref:Hsp20/alpha crystallin family protein n=1 Tax=Bacillus smithii TaxID=1479 RepID=UPI0030C94B8C